MWVVACPASVSGVHVGRAAHRAAQGCMLVVACPSVCGEHAGRAPHMAAQGCMLVVACPSVSGVHAGRAHRLAAQGCMWVVACPSVCVTWLLKAACGWWPAPVCAVCMQAGRLTWLLRAD